MAIEKLSLASSSVATVATDSEYNVLWQNEAFSQRFLSHGRLRDILTLEFRISPSDADDFLESEDDFELIAELDYIYHVRKYTFAGNSTFLISFESSSQNVASCFAGSFFDNIFAGSEQPVIIFSFDTFGIKYFNDAFAMVCGVPSVYIANSCENILYGEAVKYLNGRDSAGGRKKFIAHIERLDGKTVFLEVFPTLMNFDDERIIILKVSDVTEQIEGQTAYSSSQLPFVRHDSEDPIIVSENMIITDANERACKIWGYDTPSEMTGRHIKEFVKKDYTDRFYNSEESAWEPFVGMNKHGKLFKGEKNNRLLISHNKAVYITLLRVKAPVKRNAEAALDAGLLDAQSNLVIIHDAGGNLIKCNKSMLDFFGCPAIADFKQKHEDILQLFVNEDSFLSAANAGADWYMLPHRNPKREYRVKFYAADGEPKIFSISTNIIESAGTSYIVTSLTDITETVQQNYILKDVNDMLKEQYEDIQMKLSDNIATLVQQSKLAIMGEMIGVISHQWKQPLNTIGLIAQNLEDMMDDPDPEPLPPEEISDMMKQIMKHVMFMSETVDNFRDFFKKNTQRLFFPITQAIESTLNLVSPVTSKGRIVIEKDYPDNHSCFLVFGFPNDFKQVLMNILINAMDSISAKINAGNAEEGSGNIILRLSKSADYQISLTISDNGTGLSKEVIDNMFNMSFTTKGESGTGIGMYMSKRIVDNLGGEINVANHSCGAEVTMMLPVLDKSLSKRR